MGKVLYGVIAVLASLILVDSLNCNSCPFGLAGLCFFPSTASCSNSSSVCFTSTATFPSVSSFKGFVYSSCSNSSSSVNCGTSNATLLGFSYTTTTTCCSTDKCNAVSAAPSTKMTLSAVLGVAAVASVWGSLM